jgi:putative ABC transport system substrate-binding protein
MSQVLRRRFLIAIAGLAAISMPVYAQTERRVRRIGYLGTGNAQTSADWLAAFRQGMAALNWVEGRDYVIDARYANSDAQTLSSLADEFVASQPELLLITGDETARLLAQKTKNIPIVYALAQDPLGNGLAASLRRPGGNMTGLSSLTRDLAAKRLQLLKEAVPRVAHVMLLFDPGNAGSVSQVRAIEEAAARLGMRATAIGLRKPADIEPAFKRGAALGVQGYMPIASPSLNNQRQAIVERILRSKAPSIFSSETYVEAGGLMSYGSSAPDNFRRAAGYVDKILKGAKPGELPIEQPTKFEFVVNLKTARTLGLKIPQSLLLRADRVIE